MSLNIPGIAFSSVRSHGSGTWLEFGFTQGQERQQVEALIRHFPINAEAFVQDPGNRDCARYIRRTQESFDIKRACHGASGTWSSTSAMQAAEWLLPAAIGMAARSSFSGGVLMVD